MVNQKIEIPKRIVNEYQKIYKPINFKKKKFKINDLVNTEYIKSILTHRITYETKFVKVIKIKNHWIVHRKRMDMVNKYAINEYKGLFNERMIITNIKILISYILLEFHLLIENFNQKNINVNELKENLGILLNKKFEQTNKTKNTELLITYKTSYELPRDKNRFPHLNALMKEIGILSIELPFAFQREATEDFLHGLLEFKEKYKIKNLKFHLKIKKIKKYKATGLYIKNANTIIIDPRHMHSIFHEIGHHIFEKKVPFSINGKRIYASYFEKLSSKIEIAEEYKEIEGYDLKSEKFAFWFDGNIL